MRPTLSIFLAGLALAACSDDTKPSDATNDAATSDADAGDGSTVTGPDYFPAKTTAPDESLALDGLSSPVRVVYDNRGIPHIYGQNPVDLAYVQGYVTARDRMFQMHTLRSAAKGRLAESLGNSNLSGDVYLRLLHLGSTGEAMAAYTKAHDPDLEAALEAYSKGVNAYLTNLRAGKETPTIEIALFGDKIIYDWTPADTMAIVRLQTWDLGFGGFIDELDLFDQIQALRARFADGPLAKLYLDVANFEPAAKTATLEPDGGAKQSGGTFDLAKVIDKPFFARLDPAYTHQLREGFAQLENIPHRVFRGAAHAMYGSNNWVIGGQFTASGKPLVCNDTHLALRNPAVFYQVAMSDTMAGGSMNIQGVNFAGAPGIVLGHNDVAAWGATVFFSDVTDMYVEKLSADHTQVMVKGVMTDLVKRDETFQFTKTGDACVDIAPSYVKNLAYTQSDADGVCSLTVTFLEVPGHGPLIPWSFKHSADGDTAVSWAWTGFEPTDELGAVWRLGTVASFDDFKAALDRFGVGAQNWIYGDTAGNIGWYPSHILPKRKNIVAGDYDYPPFLPMPGDTGDNDWDGVVPRAELPQAYNPAKGFLVTANADPVGISFDNDPFDDGPNYIGYVWDTGYRVDQITARLKGLMDSGHKITREDTKSIQADHKSRFGEVLAPSIVAAVTEATAFDGDASASPYATPAVVAAAALLDAWKGLDYQAESGVGADATSDEAKASEATAIFNAFLPFLMSNLLADEGLQNELGDYMTGRLLVRLFTHPETMASYDATHHVSPLWDDQTTAGVVETEAFILVKSLKQAVDFLSDPSAVGVKAHGGFGTAEMSQWRWGALHTLTLPHNVAASYNIPNPAVLPDGFPRHGDNFGVDASNPGLFDTDFTYAHGPAIRNHYEMKTPVEFDGVIPGGQVEDPNRPHYSDEADHYAKNESPPEPFTVDDVLAAKEKIVDFHAP